MTEKEQTKICPLCAETIKMAAKVCPYCRKPQGRRLYISEQDIGAILVVVLFIGLTFLTYWFFAAGRQYLPAQHKITVLNTQVGLEKTSDYTNVVVSGILTNASNYAWDLTRFEVRFLDTAGKTVDADPGGGYSSDLNVLPHTERAFRVKLYGVKAIPVFSSSKVTVTEAKEPGLWFGD